MAYRLELAKTARSGCTNTECKKSGEKIAKGTLRHGVLVTIQEHQTWKWKHWGCVTPQLISNMKDATEDDFDLLDGYDELPEDLQVTVRRAFEQGHVDDADWKGDLEQNRPGAKGFRSPATKKQKKAAEKDVKVENGSGSQSPIKPVSKKRGRAKKEEGHDAEVEEPPAKKPKAAAKKGKKAKAEEPEADGIGDVPSMKTTAASKKVSKKAAKDEHDSDEAPPPKKTRAKKKTSKAVENNDEHAAEDAENGQDVDPAHTKRSRAPRKTAATKVQAEADIASGDEEGIAEVQEPKKRRGKTGSKQAVTEESKSINGTARKGTRGKKAQ